MARIQSIVGQKIVIYNQDNKILILKREIKTWGHRDLPGWWIELNEDAIVWLEREILEETWLQHIAGITPIHTDTTTYEGQHSFLVWYTGRLEDDQEVVISFEHTEYRRIDPTEIENYKLKPYRIRTVKKTIKNPS